MKCYERVMGLDVGSVTVGVAVSDLLGITAQGIETISINEQQQNFGFKRLKELINEYQVTKVVIGLPKNMNNTLGPRAQASQEYGNRLKQKFPTIEVIYQDERLTTSQVERVLINDANVRRKNRKKVIDKLAAVIILQNYLDMQQ